MTYNAGSIGKLLYSLLNSTVSIYPPFVNQATAGAYCTYAILRADPDDVKESTSWVDDVTVLLSIYDVSYSAAATLGDYVRTIIDGYRGTAGGVYADSITFITESDDYDNDLRKYIKFQEYKLRILNT